MNLQKFTRAIDWTSFSHAKSDLDAAHAFMDPREAEDAGIRLAIPRKALHQ